MKILILGSSGILSRTLQLYLSKKNVDFLTISREKNNNRNVNLKNISNFKNLEQLILKIRPTHIINCIGITKFNNTYKNKKLTVLLNTKMPIYLAELCKLNKIYLLHISTDCVFSGKKGNYSDNSYKDTKDLYGLSKNKGEVKNKFTATIRTSFIGPELNTKKSLLSWFLNEENFVRGYSKAFFSGLTSLELCKIIYNYFIKKNILQNKIINIGSRRISKFTLLTKIRKIFKKNINIVRYQDFIIDRSLDSKKFRKLTSYKVVKWDKMLSELKKFMINNKYKF
jgi:dTDP-4-dehydrorhamnose reductase